MCARICKIKYINHYCLTVECYRTKCPSWNYNKVQYIIINWCFLYFAAKMILFTLSELLNKGICLFFYVWHFASMRKYKYFPTTVYCTCSGSMCVYSSCGYSILYVAPFIWSNTPCLLMMTGAFLYALNCLDSTVRVIHVVQPGHTPGDRFEPLLISSSFALVSAQPARTLIGSGRSGQTLQYRFHILLILLML